MRRHRQELKPMSEMNVTNLLDTAFILLMAFMIVAPAIKHGIELDLPKVSAANIDSTKTVTVVVRRAPLDQSGEWIYVEERRLLPKELGEELVRKKRIFPEMDVLVEGDKDVRWETMARVLATITAAGIENVSLVTEPEN